MSLPDPNRLTNNPKKWGLKQNEMKQEKLKLWVNGETHLIVNPDGRVVKVDDFPCSTAGRSFMDQIHREKDVGHIGQGDIDELRKKIQDSPRKIGRGYQGWALDIEHLNQSVVIYRFMPSKTTQ